jgi:2',3'-cyclic-nucleotide 2'-phosphodiesterase (5'-nucleotidase family)
MYRMLTGFLTACLLLGCAQPEPLRLTLIGTNDVHGALLAGDDHGGLVTFSGYVNSVRTSRQQDGGAFLLIDAGDMWQGTLESNITEGASIVAAFNALEYDAAAIGNHEFDFGPLGPAPIPASPDDDPRGALKQRAKEARFPFLAANLIDDATGKPVDWENVQPSVILEVDNIKVAVIGVMSQNALAATIAANTTGLRVAPLAETIEREAKAAIAQGATVVIVTAHAGGECTEFDDPYDLSSCETRHEIFRVAEALPAGLIDHIVAGHIHKGLAHVVNGISITSSYSRTAAFSRVDLFIDRETGKVKDRKLFPPTALKAASSYEGVDLVAVADVAAIAERAAEFAVDVKNRKVGITLETPFELNGDPESPLGNLYTDTMLDESDADISIHVINGGIRANLPAGELTFGSVYEMSPFDNQLMIIKVSGADLRKVISEQAHRASRRIGFAGMRVNVSCTDNIMSVEMRYNDGRRIEDADTVRVAVTNYLALGGDRVLTSIMPDGGYALQPTAPMVRDVILQSLASRGGSISTADFDSSATPRWQLPDPLDRNCRIPASP